MPEDTRKCEPPIAETPARGGLACAEGFRGRFFCQQLVLVLTGCDDGHILSRSLKENKDLREAIRTISNKWDVKDLPIPGISYRH